MIGRLVLVLGCLSACAPAPERPLDAAATGAIRDSVRTAMVEYEAAVRAFDVERIADFYSEDSSFRMISGQQEFSRAAILELLAAMRPTIRLVEGGFRLDSLRIVVLSRESAVATVPYLDVLTDTAGVVTTIPGSVMWAWRREPAGWRIISGQAAPGAPRTGR